MSAIVCNIYSLCFVGFSCLVDGLNPVMYVVVVIICLILIEKLPNII